MDSKIESEASLMATAILEAEKAGRSFNQLEYSRQLRNEKGFTIYEANNIAIRAWVIVKERRDEVHAHQTNG